MRWHSAIWLAVVLVLLGHRTAPGVEGLPNSTCLGCHTPALDEMPAEVRATMVETGALEPPQPAEELLRRESSLAVDEKAFQASVHGFLNCTACHQDIVRVPHRQRLKRVACEACHIDAGTAYRKSAHARAITGGTMEAATCQDCHGNHDIRPVQDPASRVYPANVPETCGSCHASPDFPPRRAMRYIQPFEAYSKSIHFKAVSRGFKGAPTCASCHGNHSIKSSTDSASTIFWTNIPKTCASCHLGIYQEYKESIHGKAVLDGIRDAPVCTDCHGEHEILDPKDPKSRVYVTHVAETCSRCHGAAQLMSKFGIKVEQVATYEKSFHGIASKFGSTSVANCSSCHGVHDIRPSSDPKSAIHKDNLPATCGKCHEGANINYTMGTMHVDPTKRSAGVIYWVGKGFKWLTFSVMVGLLAHIFLDLNRRSKDYKVSKARAQRRRDVEGSG